MIAVTYNQKSYIRECLDSIIGQQTRFPFEVIVHDDASTDGTREIVEEYAVKFPDVVVPVLEEENQYQFPCFGALYENVRRKVQGKYIACLDGDDFFCDNEKLQLQYEALEAHPDCSM